MGGVWNDNGDDGGVDKYAGGCRREISCGRKTGWRMFIREMFPLYAKGVGDDNVVQSWISTT